VVWNMLLELALQADNFAGLRAFGTGGDSEFDLITFVEFAVSAAGDGAVVHEDIGATFALNESETFLAVEPLYGAGDTICHDFGDSPSHCKRKPELSWRSAQEKNNPVRRVSGAPGGISGTACSTTPFIVRRNRTKVNPCEGENSP
jgi:hypothetical protein